MHSRKEEMKRVAVWSGASLKELFPHWRAGVPLSPSDIKRSIRLLGSKAAGSQLSGVDAISEADFHHLVTLLAHV